MAGKSDGRVTAGRAFGFFALPSVHPRTFPARWKKGMGRRPRTSGLPRRARTRLLAGQPSDFCVCPTVDATSPAPAVGRVCSRQPNRNWVPGAATQTAPLRPRQRTGRPMRVLPCHRASHRTAMTHPSWRLFPIRLPRHPLHSSCASHGTAGLESLCVGRRGGRPAHPMDVRDDRREQRRSWRKSPPCGAARAWRDRLTNRRPPPPAPMNHHFAGQTGDRGPQIFTEGQTKTSRTGLWLDAPSRASSWGGLP